MTVQPIVIQCGVCGKHFRGDYRMKYCSLECSKIGGDIVRRKCQKIYDNKRKPSFLSKCINCGNKIATGKRFCMEAECQRRYCREYIHRRYHSDEGFRRRMIDSAIRYNKRKRRERDEKRKGG